MISTSPHRPARSRCRRCFPRTVLVGAQFGVILVIEDGSEYQVATFRSDGIYKDGRHPQSVTFGSAQGDAQSRDFTVNGLFYDPIEKRVLDFVGGRKDLETRTLRAIGDPSARFAEDKLRLLRARALRVRPGFRNRRRDLERRFAKARPPSTRSAPKGFVTSW